MAKNELQHKPIEKSAKFRDITDIMKDPVTKASLTNYVDEAVKAKMAIDVQQGIIKGLRENALEELGLKPALFNSFVAMSYNNDYAQRLEGLEQQISLVELVMSDAGIQIGQ